MPKIKIYSLGVLLVLIFYYITSREPINGYAVRLTNFKQVRTNVFVSPNTSKSQIVYLLKMLEKSYDRNDSIIWGKISRNKKIIFCADNEIFSNYSPDTTLQAAFLSSPYFSHIVIGPKGFDIDVLSHELCHSEFFERLGYLAWYKIKILVPVWFDEGLAMQVNLSQRYSTNGWKDYVKDNRKELKKIRTIVTYNQFLNSNDKIWFNYFASKLEVERWLMAVKINGLEELVNAIDRWSWFDDAYNGIETKYLQKLKK
jgi:hypothetical protein